VLYSPKQEAEIAAVQGYPDNWENIFGLSDCFGSRVCRDQYCLCGTMGDFVGLRERIFGPCGMDPGDHCCGKSIVQVREANVTARHSGTGNRGTLQECPSISTCGFIPALLNPVPRVQNTDSGANQHIPRATCTTCCVFGRSSRSFHLPPILYSVVSNRWPVPPS
jgi:hypothetical protein